MYNPFTAWTLGFTWAQHIAAGYKGGDDYWLPEGTPVPSAGTGTVHASGLDSAGNSYFQVDLGGGIISEYMHMRSFALAVGQSVQQGQIVGVSGGAAGDWGRGQATGPHVHWDIYINGVRSDPLAYLAGHGSTGSGASNIIQENDMGSYYVRYTSSNPNEWIAINDLDKTYRIIPSGSFEDQRLNTLDSQGALVQINIADPVWGQTYGNGQFTKVP